MAQRRMFSKTITNSSQFLMMPSSSQNLYFHLGMNADDDGFCEHFTVMRMTDSKPDDLRLLQAKGFVHVFDDKVLVILDWKENNYLRADRYTKSKYMEIYKKEIQMLTERRCLPSGIPSVNQVVDERYTQDRIGKDRIGKERENTHTRRKRVPEMTVGEFKNVRLLKKEYEKLGEDHGSDVRDEAIEILSLWKEEKGRTSKNDNLAIRRWCIDAVHEKRVKRGIARPKGLENWKRKRGIHENG